VTEHLSQYTRSALHRLPFPQCIPYKVRVFGVTLIDWLGALLSARPVIFLCRPSYTAVLCPRRRPGPFRPLCDNAEPLLFRGWAKNLERDSHRSKAPHIRRVFSIFPAFENCSFPLGLDWKRLAVEVVKVRYTNFIVLI